MTPQDTQIVFVHGWWGGPWVWDAFLPLFEQRGFPCRAVELNWNAERSEYDLASFATHLDRLKTEVALANHPILIGHSAGGLLVQKLLESTKVCAAVPIASAAPRWIFPMRNRYLANFVVKYATDMLFGRPFLPDRQDMAKINLNALSADEQRIVYDRMVPISGHQALQVSVAGVPVRAPEATPPMLVIQGSADRLTPPSIGRSIARKFGADYREYAEHAHYMMREPGYQLLASDIVDWLMSVLESSNDSAASPATNVAAP